MAALKLSRRHRSERGAVLIEAGLTLPLLLLVVLGIMDFGRLFQRYEVLTNAAREGARVAVLPLTYSNAEIGDRVRQYLTAGGLDASLAPTPVVARTTVRIALPAGPCISLATVTATYPHTYSFVGGIVRFFGGTGFGVTQLTATASMRSEAAAVACP
jgi:Flp pilus assembly protein TadG